MPAAAGAGRALCRIGRRWHGLQSVGYYTYSGGSTMIRSGYLLAASAVLGLCLATTASGQLRITLGDEQDRPELQGGFARVSDLIGSRVRDAEGRNLGVLADVIADPQNGTFLYGVVVRGQALGQGGTYYPAPWSLFDTSGDGLVVNTRRQQLIDAPNFERGNWPDVSSRDWQRSIADYYGVDPFDRRGLGGTGERYLYENAFSPEAIQFVRGTVTGVWQSRVGEEIVQIQLRTQDGRSVEASLAPASYLERYGVGLSRGDEVLVRGSLVTVDGRSLLIATSLRTENQRLQLRDSQGEPAWSWQQQDDRDRYDAGRDGQERFDRGRYGQGRDDRYDRGQERYEDRQQDLFGDQSRDLGQYERRIER